ncbi:MAG: 30S ribosomal protein S2, partial [Bacteroidetes bacterium SW_11_64_17]
MADETSTQDPDVQDEASPEATAETSEDSPESSTDDSPPPESTNTETESASDTEADVSQETAPESESEPDDTEESEETSHRVTVEELLKAGAHFGHLTSRWNPRMEEYIFMERNNIHIIDLMQTQVLLDEAADAAKRFAKR